jgi:putative polyhydroxyalkanoate system protein
MPDIQIQRAHRLGLPRAREVAWQWAEDVERKFDMECTVIEGESSDTVEFTRPGVRGTLVVEPHRFALEASLGFLLGAFSKTIEAEIERNLDDLLLLQKRRKPLVAGQDATAAPATAQGTPAKKAAAGKTPARASATGKTPATKAAAAKTPAGKTPAKKTPPANPPAGKTPADQPPTKTPANTPGRKTRSTPGGQPGW